MRTVLQSIRAKIQEVKKNRLKELDLSGQDGVLDGRLTRIPAEVFELTWLEVLNFSRHQIKILPEEIIRLKNLTTLDLSYNQLTTLPKVFAGIKNLITLNLNFNKINVLPKAILDIQNLTTLNLRGNQIKTLPEAIFGLQNLTTLNLSQNQINALPEGIIGLQNLTTLYLSLNQITTLPEAISGLQNLIALDLSYNQINALSEGIIGLQNLTALYLSNNQIKTLPEAISDLQNLTALYLSNNQIKTLPEAISDLQNLTALYLSNNQIKALPESIHQLQNLTNLQLNGNLIEKPPPEIVAKNTEAIKNYFRQLEAQGKDYLYEAKLLIVGEGGAGKTTLAKKIEKPNYQLQEEDSTKGIEVIKWSFSMDNGREFRVNIWDFGGQEIYHATHQFFLTKRSLYALVADNRKEDTNFFYWLNVVELLSDNSPVLIIKNEKQDRPREINEPQLRGRFSNLEKILATNLATNRGLKKVLDEIKHYIKTLPHFGAPLPRTWVRVREALESDSRNYIRLDEYLQICQENGFTQQKDKLQLSSYLHDLGVGLHFQDDPILNNTVILKPKWGTDAVYKVLDDKKVIRNLGKFTWKDLQNIWQEEQYATKQGELLQLMINFNLCYEIPNSPKTYIAPQLLTEKQPEYEWDKSSNLILRYTYDFMPKGIITQFIVAMHRLIDGQKYVWKSGVILSHDNTKAEIIEYYEQREFKIRVAGLHKRDLLTRVTHEFDKIHDSYKQLKINQLIPCNCSVCKNQQDPHFYRFENLRDRIANQKYDIECDKKPYEKVKTLSLIDDVMDRSQLIEEKELKQSGENYNIQGQNIIFLNGDKLVKPPGKNEEQEVQVTLPWAFRNGIFYLLVFSIVFNTVGIFAGFLPIYSLALTIIGTTVLIVLIGVLQLRQDDRLSDENFVKLITMVLEQLPLIGNLIKHFTGKK